MRGKLVFLYILYLFTLMAFSSWLSFFNLRISFLTDGGGDTPLILIDFDLHIVAFSI